MRTKLLTVATLTAFASSLQADVERYKDEALYLARLAELGLVAQKEDFEGDAWAGTRSTFVDSVTHKRILWESAAHDYWKSGTPARIATNLNWDRNSNWGIFDSYLQSMLRITSPETIYAVGLWVDTNPDMEDVGFLFENRVTANAPGYVLPGYGAMYPGDNAGSRHRFIGIVDSDGFTNVVITGTLEVNEDSQLEGYTVYGADDFTFGVPAGFLPTALESWRTAHFSAADLGDPAKEAVVWGTAANPDGDPLPNDAEFGLGTDPNDPSDGHGGVVCVASEIDGQTLLTLRFLRRNDDPDITVAPERSDILGTWGEEGGADAFTEISAVNQGNGYDLVTVRELPSTVARQRSFGRVRILRATP